MPLGFLFAVLVVAGIVVAVISLLVLRGIDAHPGRARRLAGPPEVKVGRLLDATELPTRAVRVSGRIRCRDPLHLGDGERLVAFHRDVEVLAGGSWRSIERMRETRSFDLWDHDGSIGLDPAQAAEPLITIPHVWRGSADELEEPHASAAARLAERHGPIEGARAVTRTINVTDRLLVLARPVRGADGRLRLEPPDGGYLISSLPLDDAMRLLGGRNRRAAAGGVIGLGVAVALLAIGGIGAFLTALLS
jgi:hypothetical protein